MAEQRWYQRYAEGIVIGILACIAWGILVYLYAAASPLAGPLFFGSIAGGIVVLAGAAISILSRMPERRTIPTSKNMEKCVRTWLDNHHLAVKNDPDDKLYFRLRITADYGKQMTIFRSKKAFTEYVEIQADLSIRGEDVKILDLFTEEEKQQWFFDVGLELARAKVGYAGLAVPPVNFYLFQRVPILPGLTEAYFVSMIGNVEAAMNLVVLMFARVKQKADARTGAPLIMLPSTSDAPKPELPAT
jgi:hypothetical protein